MFQIEGVLPSALVLQSSRDALVTELPDAGFGETETAQRLQRDICPGLNKASKSPNYYGFVIGGATPAAKLADNLVTDYDQNVHVHLPKETISTNVEDAALKLLCQLLNFDATEWGHRIFTTGATSSNVLGLACGRQYAIQHAARKNDRKDSDIEQFANVAEAGLAQAIKFAGIEEVQILTTVPHSSIAKAASIVGLGRRAVVLVGQKDAPHKFDFQALEFWLQKPKIASIVVISCSEVNTGLFATTGDEVTTLRNMCDRYGAWLHVDAAFGIMARVIDQGDPKFATIAEGCVNLELADSITGDCHKLLNVPYDCGFFLSKHPKIGFSVFSNPGAAYLSTGESDTSGIISPLQMGIENSRRFRALPVYATLLAYGRQGYKSMLEKQINLARLVAAFISSHEGYELLPSAVTPAEIYMIVLFRAKDEALNTELVKRINATSRIYVSGTAWNGKPACRIAVSNWQAEPERDVAIIKGVLVQVLKDHTYV